MATERLNDIKENFYKHMFLLIFNRFYFISFFLNPSVFQWPPWTERVRWYIKGRKKGTKVKLNKQTTNHVRICSVGGITNKRLDADEARKSFVFTETESASRNGRT